MGFETLARGSGLLLPGLAVPATRQEQRVVETTGWKRDGLFIGRVWPAEMTERDYQIMRVGGKRRWAHPKEITPSGCRIYALDEAEQRRIWRWMDRSRDLLDRFEYPAALRRFQFHNVACNGGRSTLLNFLAGSGSHTGITYFEVGTGAGTPASTDTSDFTAVFRKAITTATVTGNQVDESTFFQATEGNYTYTNAGAWGDGATSTLGSGVLFAHAVYNYNKLSSVALTNDYLITLS